MFRFCQNVCNDSNFAIYNRVCIRIVFDVQWNISFVCFIWLTYVLNCFSLKCLTKNCLYERRFFYDFIRFAWNIFHQNARSKVVCIDDVFSLISFDLQYFCINFEMFFIKMLDQKLYHASDVFFLKIFCCQCECDHIKNN